MTGLAYFANNQGAGSAATSDSPIKYGPFDVGVTGDPQEPTGKDWTGHLLYLPVSDSVDSGWPRRK